MGDINVALRCIKYKCMATHGFNWVQCRNCNNYAKGDLLKIEDRIEMLEEKIADSKKYLEYYREEVGNYLLLKEEFLTFKYSTKQ